MFGFGASMWLGSQPCLRLTVSAASASLEICGNFPMSALELSTSEQDLLCKCNYIAMRRLEANGKPSTRMRVCNIAIPNSLAPPKFQPVTVLDEEEECANNMFLVLSAGDCLKLSRRQLPRTQFCANGQIVTFLFFCWDS